jgi:uncharacterized membrane protein
MLETEVMASARTVAPQVRAVNGEGESALQVPTPADG